MRIKGKVELFTPTLVSGWLAVFGKPDEPVRLELLLDGVSIALSAAQAFRPDVAAAGFGDGACQFEFALKEPLTPAESARLRLRIAGSDLCLELPRETHFLYERPRKPSSGVSADSGASTGPLKVFIVGSPRSGTSVLLRAMQHVVGLQAHGESHVMPALAQAVFHLRSYHERFEQTTDDLLIKQLRVERIEEPLFESIRAFYKETYSGKGWVDKTPTDEAVHGAALIRQVFPDARLIVTRRNGIEVVDSYRRKFGTSFREACENWGRVMMGIALLRDQCSDILEIDQFDLANVPLDVGQRIGTYIGTPRLSSKIAEFLANDREDRMSTHDWKTRLTLRDVAWSNEERQEFDQICGPLMRENGYLL